MNLTSPGHAVSKFLFRVAMKSRRLLPKKRSQVFGSWDENERSRIERIYVINLDRQPTRWVEMEKELRHVLDRSGAELWNLAERWAAVDAIDFVQEPLKDADIDPIYTLGEQLFVEPQPLVLPSRLELDSPIKMSRSEIAVARSHINIWRRVAESAHEYVLVLEDDVWFRPAFVPHVNEAWCEIEAQGDRTSNFDILYLSYEEVKYGAPKTSLSRNVFRPERGLWHLSGYVISREGAKRLLQLLPCRGPIDLWINHQFKILDVRATRRSVIHQRRDLSSTNSYSILPALTRIGAITSEKAALFHTRPSETPVFAFGPPGSGLSSLALALSMLGYRCCSDLQTLPDIELETLLRGANGRVFDAYVNIGALAEQAQRLKELYPDAKFIVTAATAKAPDRDQLRIIEALNGAKISLLYLDTPNKWKVVCEHLRCVPPTCSFPELPDHGQEPLLPRTDAGGETISETLKRDKSPWLVEARQEWHGIHSAPINGASANLSTPVKIIDHLEFLDTQHWFLRGDTFTDNLALFRPSNIEFRSGLGATLSVKREFLSVREYSAASVTSHDLYLFGRFEAIIKAPRVPGVITGFFLHRDSPRQEVDLEIMGNRTDRILANVFYNPGDEGAKFDYGYRGSPSYIDLGFDASEAYHRFAIEWGPREIRWFVDDRLVHRRVNWDPTPLPHLPMALHVNTWPSRSKTLAGRLVNRRLPAATFVKSIVLEANRYQKSLPI